MTERKYFEITEMWHFVQINKFKPELKYKNLNKFVNLLTTEIFGVYKITINMTIIKILNKDLKRKMIKKKLIFWM